MNTTLGELAALATSLFFTTTSTLFTLASRRVGSLVLNRIRLILAVLFLVGAHLLLGISLPLQAGREHWLWLSLSGIVGLVLGDAFLFQAFVWVGPRLSMLMMSLAPILSTLLAWIFLAERLSAGQVFGILLTLSGVAWVILERRGQVKLNELDRRNFVLGILFGLGAATGQAIGLITAKKGLGGDFPALSGTLIRMTAAMITLWLITILQGQARPTFQRLSARPKTALVIFAGAFFGPFLGVTFSLVAIQNAQVGVASTLMALPPVFLLPVGFLVFKERFGWQAILGTAVAMIGVALLFLV